MNVDTASLEVAERTKQNTNQTKVTNLTVGAYAAGQLESEKHIQDAQVVDFLKRKLDKCGPFADLKAAILPTPLPAPAPEPMPMRIVPADATDDGGLFLGTGKKGYKGGHQGVWRMSSRSKWSEVDTSLG